MISSFWGAFKFQIDLFTQIRIRDLDMAKEMAEYSKNNILAQAGESMFAQANQSTQGVLSLLG